MSDPLPITAEATPGLRLCARCKGYLGDAAADQRRKNAGLRVSHGLCWRCADLMLDELREQNVTDAALAAAAKVLDAGADHVSESDWDGARLLVRAAIRRRRGG